MKRYLIHYRDVMEPEASEYYVVTDEDLFRVAKIIQVGDHPDFDSFMETLDQEVRESDEFPKRYFNKPKMEFEDTTSIKVV